MRVLLIHQAFVSPSEAGGTRHFELAQAWARRGNRFLIVASPVSYLSGRRTSTTDRESYLGGRVEVVRAWTPSILHANFFCRVLALASFMLTSLGKGLFCGPLDLVLGTSPSLFQAASAWLVAALRRKPFLLEIRDLWPDFAIDMGVVTNPLLIKSALALESFLYRRAKHIVVNSPAYREILAVDKGVPRDKISLVPNGVDPEMFDPDQDGGTLRAELGVAPDDFLVTYAGAMGPANDLGVVLEAARLLEDRPGIKLLLAGGGKERPALEARAAELGLDNLVFAGPSPKSEMPRVLAASDACLAILKDIPMFRTTYPNKVFDYMAAGRPVVLAIDGVIRQVVEDAEAGVFVPPGDPKALAAAIEELATDPAKAREMGRRGRAAVVEHFDRRRQAARFIELLADVASGAGRGARDQ